MASRLRSRWASLGPAVAGFVAAVGAFAAVASGWAAWRGLGWTQIGWATITALVTGSFAYGQVRSEIGKRGRAGRPRTAVDGGVAETEAVHNVLPARPGLFELPPDISDFTGREEVLAELCALLLAPEQRSSTAVAIAAIAGKAGVGKTTVAIHAAHRLAPSFPAGQLYVNLRGAEADAADPEYVLAQLLLGLGVRRAALPDGLEERARLYRSNLHGRRMLVVLDSAASEAQVRPLLPGSASCAVLITSRARLDGLAASRTVDLDVLPTDQAVELLAKVAGAERVGAEQEAAEEIVKLCGDLPLAIRIAGAKLAARRSWPLAKLAERLRDEQHRLLELKIGDLEVRASFELSYHGQREEEQRAFRLLGLLSALDFPAWVAGALLDAPLSQAGLIVEHLVDAQLLEIASEDAIGQTRFRFHDLLRVFARERLRAEEGEEARRAALERALGAYLALADEANRALSRRTFPSIHQGMAPRWPLGDGRVVELARAGPLAWFTVERTNLIVAVERAHEAGLTDLTWELADNLGEFLDLRTHWTDWQHTNELALDAARQAGDEVSEAHWICRLGQLEAAQSPESAIPSFSRALAIFRAHGDRRGEAYALNALAASHKSQGRWSEAIGACNESLRISREVGDRHAEAQALRSLGMMRRDQGHYDDADVELGRSAMVFEELGDRNSWAHATRSLGELRRRQRRFEEAVARLERSLETFREQGDRRGEGQALRGLADTYRDQGRFGEARAAYDRSVAVFRAYGGSFAEAYALRGLGILHCHQGRYDEAVACFRQCLPTFRVGDRFWEGRTQSSLGQALAAKGDSPGARAAWSEALAIFSTLATPEAAEVASWLRGGGPHAAARPGP